MQRHLALATLILALPGPAPAESPRQCGPREAVIALLADRYGESRQAMGLAANNAVVELFANAETGSWTITGTMASGTTCLIASGEAYQALAETLIPGEGA
ncbi:hypothetical protein [Rhodovulum euryhalinum]|uniref:Uncharacterized protein n=1 Tax=Rhodovulum euryhalinum TaxID=35805 RepID=A0A4V2SAL2_9RHOB|nr:hypothetical protein [Rhodovulum euryhalinum]TCO72060.1 hypothetical protein EV655_105167 [Rhodovulum euryhalinum]